MLSIHLTTLDSTLATIIPVGSKPRWLRAVATTGLQGERSYHPSYCVAFVLDRTEITLRPFITGRPDGSAESVVIEAGQ